MENKSERILTKLQIFEYPFKILLFLDLKSLDLVKVACITY